MRSTWKWSINKRATFGFLLGLLAIVCLSVFSYWFVANEIQITSQVVHAQAVIKEVRDLSLLIEHVDSDELRFLITDEPQFKERIEQQLAPLESEIIDVFKATSNEPSQRVHVEDLRRLAEEKTALTRKRIALHQTGFGASESVSDLAREDSDLLIRFRAIVSQIEDEQNRVLEVRAREANRMAARSYFVIPLSGVVGFTILIIAIWSFNEQARRRMEAEAEARGWASELDDRVKQRTAELQLALNELESFSYSVAHDLRAPVRAIGGYAQILQEDYPAGIDDDAKRLLEVIGKEAVRMGRLIDDLLAFSRMGRQEMEWTRVDMQAMAKAVFEEEAAADPNRKIDFQLNPLPPAFGDSSLLRQVWINLISNAIKFTRHCDVARIEIGSRKNENEIIYFIKDNGVGFDMRYVGKLFNVFQRLHSQEEFSGTGVGLALAQRIIHRHGGKILAESKPGDGATFFFSLPGKKQVSP